MKAPDLQMKLQESENLIREISQTWEEKLRKTEQVHKVSGLRFYYYLYCLKSYEGYLRIPHKSSSQSFVLISVLILENSIIIYSFDARIQSDTSVREMN